LTVNKKKLSENAHEQCRASKATKVVAKHCPDFSTRQVVLQKLFLTNTTNKQNFLTIISSEFNWHCGIQKCGHTSCVIVLEKATKDK